MLRAMTELMEKALKRYRATLPEVRYGTVSDATAGQRPMVKFDGETVASGRRYPYLSSYTPTLNDKVQLIRGESGTWVVQGKVV